MLSKSRILRTIASILLAAVFGGILLEAGARLLERRRGTSRGPAEHREEIAKAVRMLSRQEILFGGHLDETIPGNQANPSILHPYFGYERLQSQLRMVEDQEAYRRPESESAFDICVLGGSVAHTFGILGAKRLEEKLQKDPRLAGREIRIHDSAVQAFKQLQLVHLLAYFFALGHRPDAVIELDGFNEAAHGWANMRAGTHPLYPYLAQWANAASGYVSDPGYIGDLHRLRTTQDRARGFGERLLAGGTWRSAALRLWFGGLRRDYERAYARYVKNLASRRDDRGVKGPAFEDDEGSVARQIAAGWEQASISMHGMCAERGIVYLHVLQPTLRDPGAKPATEKELAQAFAEPVWIEGVETLYPLFREAGKRLSARGVSFLDASGVFRDHPEDIYTDVCHFAERGNEILAEAVADALIAALPERAAPR